MKVLIDTNIILDMLGKREPFYEPAEKLISMSVEGKCEAYITSNTVTDIYYLARRHYMNEGAARDVLRRLLKVIGVLEVGQRDCLKAFDIPVEDYEDALLACCARRIKADYIVTRDIQHFKKSPIKPILPEELLKLI